MAALQQTLAKSDGRAGRDADGDGKLNEGRHAAQMVAGGVGAAAASTALAHYGAKVGEFAGERAGRKAEAYTRLAGRIARRHVQHAPDPGIPIFAMGRAKVAVGDLAAKQSMFSGKLARQLGRFAGHGIGAGAGLAMGGIVGDLVGDRIGFGAHQAVTGDKGEWDYRANTLGGAGAGMVGATVGHMAGQMGVGMRHKPRLRAGRSFLFSLLGGVAGEAVGNWADRRGKVTQGLLGERSILGDHRPFHSDTLKADGISAAAADLQQTLTKGWSEHAARAAAQATAAPTEAQAKAGNYAKGRLKVHGLDVVIETPAGTERRGVGPDGKPWSVRMPAHYGYVGGTKGADGDAVDVYLGPAPSAKNVYVVDQIDPATGQFDEHKCVLGCHTEMEAAQLYRDGFSDGSGARRMGAITAMPIDQFKDWLRSGDTKNPVAYAPPMEKFAQIACALSTMIGEPRRNHAVSHVTVGRALAKSARGTDGDHDGMIHDGQQDQSAAPAPSKAGVAEREGGGLGEAVGFASGGILAGVALGHNRQKAGLKAAPSAGAGKAMSRSGLQTRLRAISRMGVKGVAANVARSAGGGVARMVAGGVGGLAIGAAGAAAGAAADRALGNAKTHQRREGDFEAIGNLAGTVIGGMVGGTLGGASGVLTGPGAIATAIAGEAAGAYGGGKLGGALGRLLDGSKRKTPHQSMRGSASPA
ncbi:hypothetical protein TSO5_10525 [Azospirillum sp. TSO5]|nr:hypothetical protein TSO5_10525 [Azospirillum sp. TSO5]